MHYNEKFTMNFKFVFAVLFVHYISDSLSFISSSLSTKSCSKDCGLSSCKMTDKSNFETIVVGRYEFVYYCTIE